MEFEKIKEIIYKSLEELYEKDKYIIDNEKKGKYNYGSERSIVFRFGIYFENNFKKQFTSKEYEKYSIDVEYNRNITNKKILPDWENGCILDLIVHERGNNNNNLVVLEFKTHWNDNQDKDKVKMKKLIDKNGVYKYRYGAIVLIEKEYSKKCVDWISL